MGGNATLVLPFRQSLQNPLALPRLQSECPALDTNERFPVPTGNAEPYIERDEAGRAYWSDGSRITWSDVVECDEDGEPPEALIDVLVRHGLWVLRDGHEALVTWDGIQKWLEMM